jgi:hypothetical protein
MMGLELMGRAVLAAAAIAIATAATSLQILVD